MKKSIYPSIMMTIVMFVLLGCLYPIVTTLFVQFIFPYQSHGSIIVEQGVSIGSELIGQSFTSPNYFHGRPSAAGEKGYDAANSNASNLGPTEQSLISRMKITLDQLLKENPTVRVEDIPTDLLTTSGSGLDPHISVKGAMIQISRVAKARAISEDKLKLLVDKYTQKPYFGFIGSSRVNVLLLNRALDKEKL